MTKVLTMKVEGSGFDAIVNLANGFGPAIQKEMVIAVNRTAKFEKKQIAKRVSKEVAIKQKDAKKVIDVRKAQRGRPTAEVNLHKTNRLPLKRFGARQTKSGVSYRISKKGGRQKISNAFGPNIGRLGNHVFVRVSKKRKPIRKLYGVSVAGVYGKHNMIVASKKGLSERLEYELNRRVRAINVRLIRRNGRKKGLSTDAINQQIAAL